MTFESELAAGKQAENTLLIEQLQAGRMADYWAYYVMVAGIVISLFLGLITGILLNRSNIQKTKKIELQHLLIDEREKERLKLARDLHDGPVQELLAISFTVQELLMENAAPNLIEHLRTMKTSLQCIVSELRASAMELKIAHPGQVWSPKSDLIGFGECPTEVSRNYRSFYRR